MGMGVSSFPVTLNVDSSQVCFSRAFKITVVRPTTMMFDYHFLSMALHCPVTHWFLAVFWLRPVCMSRIKIGRVQPFSCHHAHELVKDTYLTWTLGCCACHHLMAGQSLQNMNTV
jgi:hypothetical protein